MIIFPKEAKYEYCKESKIIENCKELLEKALRKLGNFKTDESIIVTDYKHGEKYYDFIYEVKDLNSTVFAFYNFQLGDGEESDNRFEKNYQLTMKKENSNFYYKYNFNKMNYKNYIQGLRMIEVSYLLTGNRLIKLERKLNQPIRLIMNEKEKKYMIVFYDHSEEHDTFLLEDFENMVAKANEIEEINLENILKIIRNLKKVRFAFIYKKDKIIAKIDFNNGNISKYQIEEDNRKIEVTIDSKITRNVERVVDREMIIHNVENSAENMKKIQSDYKILFKSL